ncbi:CLD4 protein, partial [Calyptomena viridis]|nr:CLD4 protein [Calyptomena viridis]
LIMMSMQLGGVTMAALGWLGSILTCALPMWKMTAYVGSNVMMGQLCSEGLWLKCTYEPTGQTQCKAYDSLLELTPDLQTARVMVVTALFVSLVGFIIFLAGGDFTRCFDDNSRKNRYTMVSGALFIVAGILILIPVSWTADNIISNFYSSIAPEALNRELGAALYIGWAASILLILGGVIMCRSGDYSPQDSYPRKYKVVKTIDPAGCP